MIAVSEGLSLGEKLGMDPKVLSDIMSVSTSRCWSIDTYNPRPGMIATTPSSRGYTGGFGVSLIKKDLTIAQDVGRQIHASLEFSNLALDYFTQLEKSGEGGKDFSYVYKLIHGKK